MEMFIDKNSSKKSQDTRKAIQYFSLDTWYSGFLELKAENQHL